MVVFKKWQFREIDYLQVYIRNFELSNSFPRNSSLESLLTKMESAAYLSCAQIAVKGLESHQSCKSVNLLQCLTFSDTEPFPQNNHSSDDGFEIKSKY